MEINAIHATLAVQLVQILINVPGVIQEVLLMDSVVLVDAVRAHLLVALDAQMDII